MILEEPLHASCQRGAGASLLPQDDEARDQVPSPRPTCSDASAMSGTSACTISVWASSRSVPCATAAADCATAPCLVAAGTALFPR